MIILCTLLCKKITFSHLQSFLFLLLSILHPRLPWINILVDMSLGEGKAVPLTGRGSPQGCEGLTLPYFLDNRLIDGDGKAPDAEADRSQTSRRSRKRWHSALLVNHRDNLIFNKLHFFTAQR
jgi:hypothetical protein